MNNLLTYDQIINESVNDYSLYHFTDYDCLIDILKEKTVNPSTDSFHSNFISTTRFKSFSWLGAGVRISFDKRMLQTKFKIEPIHYFNLKHFYDYSDDYRSKGHGDTLPKTKMPSNQYEERITAPNGIPISPYIIKITLLKEIESKDSKLFKAIKRLCATNKIPLSLVNKH